MATSGSGSFDPQEFGANQWLVEQVYEQFQKDPASVDKEWLPILQNYRPDSAVKPAADQPAPASTGVEHAPSGGARLSDGTTDARLDRQAQLAQQAEEDLHSTPHPGPVPPVRSTLPTASPFPTASIPIVGDLPVARTTNFAPAPKPIPADRNTQLAKPVGETPAEPDAREPVVTPLRGMPKALARNMDESLTVPTATSVRTIPAKILIDNRIVINNHLKRSLGGKVSFTQIIGWALVQALKSFPSQNVYYDVVDGKPSVVQPAHINLGIAVDVPKKDGTRALLVPGIKQTEEMDFEQFITAYDQVVDKARHNKLTADDFSGVTISLTNPGGIGTVHSVPRLMKGQGTIIGAGALNYPAEYSGVSAETIAKLGISKVVTLTSTYDHRVIQGAGSGQFLKIVHELLLGDHGFYDDIFESLRLPYEPVRWVPDVAINSSDEVGRAARVQQLIHAYRVRGHLIANIDPLEYHQRRHPDLDILTHGLTHWDLDRSFVTGGITGAPTAKLREILGQLRDSYCRNVGVEYMHIQDPEQREWLQDQLERPYSKPGHDTQLHILKKLNEAEAFETFLQTKFVGQKRFSLEGSESLIALLDEVLQRAADEELDEVGIGMAHRGRLNVLTNIAGKTYAQVFREFEGTQPQQTGSGDVKYHLGTEGVFTSEQERQVKVYLAANPSHLEVVNTVLEGIVRAKQDAQPHKTFNVLPILVHGDAAFAGQGSVYEALQMSQLRGYRTGGTIHVIVNNQIGFTTKPYDGRSSVYPTDVGRTIQAPIFHVNGDDPESVVRVAELAFQYRQRFHGDVLIDMVSYRRRGHNEGDDPSMTQPLMYGIIESKRSVRALYTSALIGRGDITQEEYDKADADFHAELERAFNETHAAQKESYEESLGAGGHTARAINDIQLPEAQQHEAAAAGGTFERATSIPQALVERIGDAHVAVPEGFTVHRKLKKVLEKRFEMSRNGHIDWAFGELLAFGSLLVQGVPVRFTGQDSRRGTFVQRHAVLHDQKNGQEWFPLLNLANEQAGFWIYDSLLSEFAVMAFEYGYSVENTKALTLWEGQFGDFANGAQTVIDEFISSAEQKWGQRSGLVLLLPHGYEGQGPDHSSARIERYLSLAAQENLIVAQPSTPASHFHLLRRQAFSRPQHPLIVITPKSMLRLKTAVSPVEDFTHGQFEPVLDETRSIDKNAVRRVVVVSGRLYWEMLAALQKSGDTTVALVRLEQYYPLPETELRRVLAQYPNAELVFAQDEPENQGAWPFLALHMPKAVGDRKVQVVSREAAASPATGSQFRHKQQEADLIARAFG
ncbi:multifunctional oxoglutarate decarboxylase/oxoglutarate dehydrogenase thiamine pyrophosphate-binding subunit/dihydrolipoyllysine-residue succinyltransferase subunit [Pseudoclavibacter sp. CFCC 11306]|uniref:multifunctional oxoglutarate decarboxylase/oxoglutarate dehydrogenase thiamine pyrophosphate-binding subunit/dihydrolipoyllysine-residue succinyltransferase subunit n=1 Tax=Pseudoclavibacter sp. CFCC 11306 TaxID=1564493 RepID=UPI0013011F63|nr:multifunctional oxoglutarate decarboxylase/oxoglutarate dehydrogenase thiamine pyrophosphate-binding subunit/dihydrolipoyllysine-residue succinyltransferase subunit [Pseudoclavibacter sp. CFCC 11306]KAB1658609.1 multifunctional oxoglutarate decarboxylase/oxoglutarate dehydrogenase thiamine pyrophosphate-binding subunit/dihydrolipoyllysine-residue succinyltransferase subunit [Pseudoclavibacter sp. CFCC 11306]